MCVKSENFDALPMQHNETVTQKQEKNYGQSVRDTNGLA